MNIISPGAKGITVVDVGNAVEPIEVEVDMYGLAADEPGITTVDTALEDAFTLEE